jgi:hypothetical protein
VGLAHRAQVQEDQDLFPLQGQGAFPAHPLQESLGPHPGVGQEAVEGFGLVEVALEVGG